MLTVSEEIIDDEFDEEDEMNFENENPNGDKGKQPKEKFLSTIYLIFVRTFSVFFKIKVLSSDSFTGFSCTLYPDFNRLNKQSKVKSNHFQGQNKVPVSKLHCSVGYTFF